MWGQRHTKYSNKKVILDGYPFDSQKEARRYQELRWLERAGDIRELVVMKRDLRYELVVNGIKIGTYTADFRYTLPTGEIVVEDVKGMQTPVYRLKRKLMRALHGIQIVEV